MSGWGYGWFGGGGGAATKKKDGPKNAILGLRATHEMLSKREKHLTNQMEEQDAIARKYVNTNKAAAKTALRRKKQFEHSLEQTTAQMFTLEQEINSIETANINKETMDAMRNAGGALKSIHGNLTVEKVDQVMDDLKGQHDIAEEIAEALRAGTLHSQIDDDELEDELESLQQEQLDNKMLTTGTMPVGDQVLRLPTPATGEISKGKAQEEDEEEEELRRLQAEMAM